MAKRQAAKLLIPNDRIEKSILLVRDQKVMLDQDLAELYEVETGALVRAVKRNLDRMALSKSCERAVSLLTRTEIF